MADKPITNHGTSSQGISSRGPRCVALVGPFQSGKTSLLEAILARTGAISRPGTVAAGNTVGDAGAEARGHKMSVELTAASTDFLGDVYTFLDCPGSIEFMHEMRAALPPCDAAIVVCEADERKLPQLQLVLRELEERSIPRFLFINKIDKADKRVRETLASLQPASRVPLVLRQIPIWKDGIVMGFVDLALERAFLYREHAASEVIQFDNDNQVRKKDARFTMLEKLADHDDELMEQLLEDIEPPRDKVFDDLTKELRENAICPVLIGSALHANGVLRLLKAIRHEAPGAAETAARLGAGKGEPIAQVMKTWHTAHGGKLSLSRVLEGEIGEGATVLNGKGESARVAGVFKMFGANQEKRGAAKAGDTVAFGKLDPVQTSETITGGKKPARQLATIVPPPPVMALAIAARDRKDDVKLGLALHKLVDEDPSLIVQHNTETGEIVLWGQGEMHLRVATERLLARFGVAAVTHAPAVGYRETIRKPVTQRGRHKKQTGGHGQFGDVVLEIKPLGRGEGFRFGETVKGGAVPKQYFSSVEEGVKNSLKCGPLGFPVVDIAVTLVDGSYHDVDSSDMAFQLAGRLAMSEGLPQCQPVLLQPIFAVEIVCPSDATAKINAILSQRHGQILGFDAREGWDGWDVVKALLPEAAIGDLIVEVRSATAGVGGLSFKFDHLQELTGKNAEQVVAARKTAA
jgi:elongation factor G